MTQDEVLEIYNNEYISEHIGAYSLSKKYGVDLYNQFHKYNLPLRNDVEKNKKHTCDSYFFSEINTEEKAYWLGFLMADGYITIVGNGKKFGISLNNNDIEHLYRLREAIKSNTPIHTYEVKQGYKVGSLYCRLIIADTTLVDDLISHGCVQQKSNILLPPQNIPKELYRHWIRGFMDGNGSITISNTKYGESFSIRFTSTDDVLNWIMDQLIKSDIISKRYPLTKRKSGQIVSSFEFGGNYLSKKYCDYIYKDATIYLQRKYDRYLRLCELIKKKEESKIKRCCDVCGTTKSSGFLVWSGEGEYKDKILCRKHWEQLYRIGTIIPDKNKCCDICGDDYGRLIHCGRKHIDYIGMTMCRKHYEQLDVYGKITDESRGWHKNDKQLCSISSS